jgi:hypothetical protein
MPWFEGHNVPLTKQSAVDSAGASLASAAASGVVWAVKWGWNKANPPAPKSTVAWIADYFLK